ncbi:26S proteasome regulatory subunit RPN1-like [Pieris brassicae]|uniref:Uncharacterized protein n=1 Tax=Pieris brassicae TaxID=7116 RepID=A0A9P0XFM5_PIEBR|nr:26S proteasome regulatory subunit RPN1-like [Pieris brassicae]CAH4034491.1 unnamed protein product [Pieris brassicae]
MLKFLVICVLAACCHAQNSGESLLLRIEEHQNKLRNWQEDNLRLLTTLAEKRKIYDNVKHNEAKLLEVVDYLVKMNMEVLQNVVSEMNKIKINMDKDVDEGETLRDKEINTLEASSLAEDEETVTHKDENQEGHEDGTETLSDLERELAEEDGIGELEEENVDRDDPNVDHTDNDESRKNDEDTYDEGYNDNEWYRPSPQDRK